MRLLTVSCLWSPAQTKEAKWGRTPPSPKRDHAHTNNHRDNPGSPGSPGSPGEPGVPAVHLKASRGHVEPLNVCFLSSLKCLLIKEFKQFRLQQLKYECVSEGGQQGALVLHDKHAWGCTDQSAVCSAGEGSRGAGRDDSLVVSFICKVGHTGGGGLHHTESQCILVTHVLLLLFSFLQLHPKKGNFLVPEAKALGLPV